VALRALPYVIAAGVDHVIFGTVGLCTVTVKVAVDVFPALSVAEQETVVVAIGKVEPDGGVHVTGSVPSTRSVAVALKVTTAPAALVVVAVRFPGNVKTGGVVSFTVTVNELVVLLPALSVAEQETVVVPIGKVEPVGGVHVTGSVPSTRSVAEALKVASAPLALVAEIVIFAGTDTTGGVVSCTVTVNVADPVLPALSVAEQETVVVAIGKVEPDGGVHVTGSVPSTRSVAEALKVATAPLALVAEIVIFAGTETTGGVVSCTVTLNVADPV